MKLRREWHRLTKPKKMMLVLILLIGCVGTIFSFTMSRVKPYVVEHTIDCQHIEYASISDSLKELYGEGSSVRYAFEKTKLCDHEIQLLIDGKAMSIWVSYDYASSVDFPTVNIDAIVGYCLIGMTSLTFISTLIFMYIFTKKSSVASAYITKIQVGEWINENSERRPVYLCDYEYRDREYQLHTGKIRLYQTPSLGDRFDILYLNCWPNKSISKKLLNVTKFIPWVIGIILIVLCYLYSPVLFL